MNLVLIAALGLSVLINAILITYIIIKRKKKSLDMNAKDLLHDLLRGGALVRVECLNPDNLILWKGDR